MTSIRFGENCTPAHGKPRVHSAFLYVTPFGEEVLSRYRALQSQLYAAAQGADLKALTAAMRAEPKDRQKG